MPVSTGVCIVNLTIIKTKYQTGVVLETLKEPE